MEQLSQFKSTNGNGYYATTATDGVRYFTNCYDADNELISRHSFYTEDEAEGLAEDWVL